MGCNCGKKANEQQFVFTDQNGKTKTFTSEVQAQAAKIRAGGGTVQPK